MFTPRQDETRGLYLLRWAARILSVVSIGAILLFIFSVGIDIAKLTWGEVGVLVLFPLAFLSGLILGWEEELKGGALTMASLGLLLLVLGGPVAAIWFPILAIPGLLYLTYGLLWRRKATAVTGSRP